MAEKFCLKWNDFQANVTSSFRKLRNTDDFYDVTLVSDDHQQVSAHKVVLASSSEYFNKILKKNKHSHPLLCLNGVKSNDLHNILDYIYNGEIQIYQDNLDTFLEIAQRFQLEGLIQQEEEEKVVLNNYKNVKNETWSEDINMPVVSDVSDSNVSVDMYKEKKESMKIAIQAANFETIEELDRKIEEFIEKQSDGTYQCITCGKTCKKRKDIKEHVEVHFDGLSFPCQYCEKSFRSRNSLRGHSAKKQCPIFKV